MWSTSLLAIVCVLALGIGACARKSGDGASPAKAAAATETPPPANSPLAKIQVGMSTREVENILGPPTDENAYVTGKAFIPYHFGPDHSRRAYFYKGLGRVVFRQSGAYSANYQVLKVEYDPSETGKAR